MNKALLLLCALLLPLPLHALTDDDILSPEEAYRLTTESVDSTTVRATWEITDGYYMYRDKFRFDSGSDGVVLGDAQLPPGKIKHDEFFGDMEIYRGRVVIDIPLKERSAAASSLLLKTVSQGCADIGICYPPQKQDATIVLAQATLSLTQNDQPGLLSSAIGSLKQTLGFGNDEPEFLEVDRAFSFSAEVTDANTLRAYWTIADDYYLYRDKTTFKLIDSDGITLGEAQLPPGKIKSDEFFGDMAVIYKELNAQLPLNRINTDPTDITLQVGYQGCAEAGLCYPPQTRTIALTLPSAAVVTAAAATTTNSAITEQDQLARFLIEKPLLISAGLFFLIGIGLTFTPCVFPMIPILSSIIAGQGEKLTTRHAFTLSLIYVLAMALTYTVAGIVVALAGANLQALFQNPWVLSTFAALFVLMSLSMFGFYELQMPASIQARLSTLSNRQQGGTYIGVGIMGFLSALIVGPCITAPLVATLLVIGQTGDPVLGGTALFAMSMGMGIPLLIVGTSAGKLLPKVGHWMDSVKSVFGVLLLAVAIWMLERILPPTITMALWAMLLICSAIYMGAHTHLDSHTSGWKKLWKGLSIVMLIYGGLLIIGAASGSHDPLRPLDGLNRTITTITNGNSGSSNTLQPPHQGLVFKRIKGSAELDREVAAANRQGKAVMLDFYADWCISCKEMEKYTFGDPLVQSTLANVVLLQADVTANDEIDQALLKRFGLFGPPSILFFDTNGVEKNQQRVMGFMEAIPFNDHVRRALGGQGIKL